ncbi:MAG: DUF484 family protein [Glaciimonas sp.]|nr:DUF484 family protein [Glaciimonas sp.]
MTIPLDSHSVAQFLSNTPGFFEEHAALLGRIRLSSPLTGRTLSLQERQMEVMREKYKVLELQLSDLLHHGQENDAIARKFQSWTRSLLEARNDVDLPHVLVTGLQTVFDVPQATLRLWRVAPDYAHAWFAQDGADDAMIFAGSLTAPYCGANNDFDAVRWLENAASVQSTAIIPLRIGSAPETFGLLVLGSNDPQRFAAGMATDFLSEIGTTASAALTCLLN